MAFLEDPRLRQRWNQISHNAETVTENAAAGIWNFQQRYIGPCLSSICESLDSCTALCLGDREDRARRQRERERGARGTPAEYSFDFYDDWDDDDDALAGTFGGGGSRSGILGGWSGGRAEDWDRLLAGTGSTRSRTAAGGGGGGGEGSGDVTDQPRRKRGMSYGTQGPRRTPTAAEDDPTIIPSTAPLGFLGRLPFKIGGTLRYKPSAANLRDHPGGAGHHAGADDDEYEPLLPGSDSEDDDDGGRWRRRRPQAATSAQTRKRSGTAGSGDTSSSYRSRGDLFPSDGEGDEDAVPLDDEFAVALDRVDDRSSSGGGGKTRSSKGKRRADSNKAMSRSVSRTTIASQQSTAAAGGSLRKPPSSLSLEAVPDDAESAAPLLPPPSLKDLRREEELVEREEDEEIERKRAEAARLALERGLHRDEQPSPATSVQEVKAEMVQIEGGVDEIPEPSVPEMGAVDQDEVGSGDDDHHDDGPREDTRSRDDDDDDEIIPQDDTVVQHPAADVEAEAGPGPSPQSASRSDPEQPREHVEPEFVPARLPHFR